MFGWFKPRECPSCKVLRDLLKESERRNKEMVVILKNNLDQVHEHNKELTDTVTGKNVRYQEMKEIPQKSPASWAARRAALEARDRRVRQAIQEGEESAGLPGTGTES